MNVELSANKYPVSMHSNNLASPSTPQLFSQRAEYLEKALACLQHGGVSSSETTEILGKIAMAIKSANPTKASEVFQQMLTCSENLGRSDADLFVRAKTIHFMCVDSQEKAIKAIASLECNYQGLSVMRFYLANYGVKESPLVKLCQEKFNESKVDNDYQIAAFARAFIELDHDYFLEVLKQVKDVKVRADQIISAAKSYENQVSREVIEAYIDLVDLELKKEPSDIELHYTKLKLCALRGMEAEEIENWITLFKTGAKSENSWDPRNQALKYLALYSKGDHLKRALDISLMTAEPNEVMVAVLKSITPEQLDMARPYIDSEECPLKRTQLWLSVASVMAESYPEAVLELLPELISNVEACPNGKELDWEPGMGKRRDAYISYLNKKIKFMESIVQLHFDVGAIDKAEELKNHALLKESGPSSLLSLKLTEAKFYRKVNPEQAEKCCEEALFIIKEVNPYDCDPENIKNEIAPLMFELNPDRALEIVLGMREKYNINRHLLNFVKATAKCKREFAEKCLEKMSEDRFYATDKAKGYLKLAKE